MIITGKNLKSLIHQYGIAPEQSYDQFSLTLTLDQDIIKYKEEIESITYGQDIPKEYITHINASDGYVIKPGEAVLACSAEIIKIPKGYFGLLQTKGSLARLFITINCCDGQIESCFEGKITFEICNMGNIPIKLISGQNVAQLYIFKTSDDNEAYHGKYKNATEPTLSNKKYNTEK